jgi:beta-aspartyl-peptidase (threonine type)
MKFTPLAFVASTLAMTAALSSTRAADGKPFGLVIHGGAGVILRENLTADQEAKYRAGLTDARDAGYAVLERGGTALDAVIAVITRLEDNPLFNAGKGAVMTADGKCELDSSIMDGRTLAAGAVAGVQHVKNPILLARAVMEKSEHVMLSGDGAERFAKLQGLELVPNEYFQTDLRRKQLEKAQKTEADKKAGKKTAASPLDDYAARIAHFGTVGCAAVDSHGNLAAGTSTGGMTNKKFGRIGDAPIIGAGTYASNATCAISATGWGEFFIRIGVARDIAAQMEYKGASLADASAATIEKVGKLGGDGGIIAIDKDGHIAMPFNSPGMYRGYRLSTGANAIEIFRSGENH